jgi:hypothetical protein
MSPPETIRGIVPSAQIGGESPDEVARLRADLEKARRFLLSQRWCFGIGELYFGVGLGNVASVFLAEITPKPQHVDSWLWVIVGDIPPAYLVVDDLPEPIAALKAYVVLMHEWVELARCGESSEDVIPVNLPITQENAEMLQGRLTALEEHIIPWLAQGQLPC